MFSELFGFVLCDPVGLDVYHGGSATGLDLLTLYTSTEAGDEVAQRGLAIPMIGVGAGEYTLVVQHGESPTLLQGEAQLISDGWILHAQAPALCLCGVGYLTCWNPTHENVQVPVPKGWYHVQVRCSFGAGPDRGDGEPLSWIIEFVLVPVDPPPIFRADLQTDFNFTEAGASDC